MKNWVIYFLCMAMGFIVIPFATDKITETSLPTIKISSKGQINEIDSEEFALRILVAEKPSHPQAIKSLAIAARSVGTHLSLFGCKHQDFDICDNPDCCFLLGNPQNCSQELLDKYKNALKETYGMVLTTNDIPAMALFCRCAGSGTGDSKEFTYLKGVKEDFVCDEHIFESSLPYSSLNSICQDTDEIINNSLIVYDQNNKCDFGIIGGKSVSANDLTKIFGIDTKEFTLTFNETGINIQHFGVGHGLGMSLCGIENHALNGKSYEEILKIYYPDLILNKIYNN